MKSLTILSFLLFVSAYGCEKDDNDIDQPLFIENFSTASYLNLVEFTRSASSENGAVYEIMPGPAAINPDMDPTPFSDNINMTNGSYSLEVSDVNEEDSESSQDAVQSVDIRFTGSDGIEYLIDEINVIHKAAGTGDHTFFGGVGRNETMHGSTGIGNGLMPTMLSYITFWGVADLKNAKTGEVIAQGRLVHIMTTTNVRDQDLKLITSVDEDKSDHDIKRAQTHILLPPQDLHGNPDPVPGTPHGFLHMMFEDVFLSDGERDWRLAYEILPGPAALNPAMSPTPFSDKIGIGAGSYTLKVKDLTEVDSEASLDEVSNFELTYIRQNGETFTIDNVQVIHKAEGTGDHTFFGGIGLDKEMHGSTGIGNNLMPMMTSYITLWGTADLKDGSGTVIARNRIVHIMVSARVRDENLNLITSADENLSDTNPDKVETHIILPPQDVAGNPDPVTGTGHGFLHLMFEQVELSIK